MANTTYQQLLHSVALRMNALIGSQVASLQGTYTNVVLTSANFKSADWPFDSFRDAILMAEEEYANAIASCGNHPWRSVLSAFTATIASGNKVQNVSSSGLNVIGIYGTVQDADSFIVLTEQPLEVIRRCNQELWRKMELYYFKLDGTYLYHTRDAARVEVCVYSRSAQVTAYGANGSMLLPEPLEPAIVARAVSLMTRDNSYAGQAAIFRAYSDQALAQIAQGLTSVPSKSIPGPTLVETAA